MPFQGIKKVIVIGASGSVGPHIVNALLDKQFSVSVLTRATSTSTFPSNVKVVRTDYSPESLIDAFKGQDVLISTIATFSTKKQISIIDAAIAAGVKHFIPSEYGVDTSEPAINDYLSPILADGKRGTVEYLRTKEPLGISWTAICVGAFFDWIFQYPGLMGWDLPARRATIFDGGTFEYEATNLAQIGRAVVTALSPENLAETKNKYVYVNSFTVTQNQVLSALEEATGSKFEVSYQKTSDLTRVGLEKLNDESSTMVSRGGGEYKEGAAEAITAVIYGNGNFNGFSKTKGLWNERLGLPVENLVDTVKAVVKDLSTA